MVTSIKQCDGGEKIIMRNFLNIFDLSPAIINVIMHHHDLQDHLQKWASIIFSTAEVGKVLLRTQQ